MWMEGASSRPEQRHQASVAELASCAPASGSASVTGAPLVAASAWRRGRVHAPRHAPFVSGRTAQVQAKPTQAMPAYRKKAPEPPSRAVRVRKVCATAALLTQLAVAARPAEQGRHSWEVSGHPCPPPDAPAAPKAARPPPLRPPPRPLRTPKLSPVATPRTASGYISELTAQGTGPRPGLKAAR